jgi:hypothetical protein
MTILRQIKDLKTEFASIHSHVLRQVIQINGGIPEPDDPKKPLRRTLLPGFLVIGGLPDPPPYGASGIPHEHCSSYSDTEESLYDSPVTLRHPV